MNGLKWQETEHSLAELSSNHSNNFPIVAKVTEGYLGDRPGATLSTDEVLRFHTWGRHSRVLAQDHKGRYYSIPEVYPIHFRPVVNKIDGAPMLLEQLLDEYDLPVEIRMSPSTAGEFRLNADFSQVMPCGNLIAKHVYQERYLKANLIDSDGRIQPEILVIPAYVSAKVSLIDGATHQGPWRLLTGTWRRAASSFPFSKMAPDLDIVNFSRSQVETCLSSDMYEQLQPQTLLSKDEAKLMDELNVYVTMQRIKPSYTATTDTNFNVYEPVDFPKQPDQPQHAVSINPVVPPRPKPKPKPKQIGLEENQADRGSEELVVSAGLVVPPQTENEFSIACVSDIPTDISHLSIKQIGECLKLLQMAPHVQQFHDRQIDGSLLVSLDEDILREDLKLSKLDSRKLYQFARKGYRPL